MSEAVAKTGVDPAALAAMEQYFPEGERIIEDGVAEKILPYGKGMVRMMRFRQIRDWMVRMTEKSAPGVWGGQMCRKRYIDEKLADSIQDIDQVVNLGAGYDTRPFRLNALPGVPVWELDQKENTEPKRAALELALGAIPGNVKLVPIDFDREDIGAALSQSGFDISKRTFFIWEAVTQYLTEEGIRGTFDFLSGAAAGSRLAFTYVRRKFIDGTDKYGWESVYKRFVQNKLWLFGMEPGELPAFLEKYGWRLVEDKDYGELAEQYVKPTGRSLASSPVERMAYAEKV